MSITNSGDINSYQHLANLYNDGLSYEQISERVGYTVTGVRGMISRARNKGLIHDVRGVYIQPSKSVARQEAVVERGNRIFNQALKDLQKQSHKDGRLGRALFISDVHLPMQDNRAISLIEQILSIYQPDFATALNDWYDFTEFSRWEDLRPSWARLWTDDIQNALDMSARVREDWVSASPYTKWPSVGGNHDAWLWTYIARTHNGTSDMALASIMEELEKQDILVLSNGAQNTIQLSPRLKLTHGVFASSNPATVAKKTLEMHRAQSYDYEGGTYYSVGYGHDHRSIIHPDHGVYGVGAGCCCVVNMPYLRGPANWQQGIAAFDFDPNGNYVQPTLIEFRPNRKGQLETDFAGIHFISSV